MYIHLEWLVLQKKEERLSKLMVMGNTQSLLFSAVGHYGQNNEWTNVSPGIPVKTKLIQLHDVGRKWSVIVFSTRLTVHVPRYIFNQRVPFHIIFDTSKHLFLAPFKYL